MFLLGDVNTDLMHYSEHKPTNHFVDYLPPTPIFHILFNQSVKKLIENPSI